MIFADTLMKKYSTLRDEKPSMYYLEEFSYKVLQLNIKQDGSVLYKDLDLKNETSLTVNFPEFLDATSNLNLIKSIFFAYDVSINNPGKLTEGKTSEAINLIHNGDMINTLSPVVLPPDLCRVYLGYRYTPVMVPITNLDNNLSLCCQKLVEMEDNCFEWVDVTENLEEITVTNKSSVCKFKITIDLNVLRTWILSVGVAPLAKTLLVTGPGTSQDTFDLNLILHPPYVSRMSFRNSIKIIYPLSTTRLKVLDRVSFKTNRSYTTNSKIYTILFIDKQTQQRLYVFDSIKYPEFFDNIKSNSDVSKINSYFNEELESFKDSAIVTFSIPVQVQLDLAKHRNYKIRIISKDLTTQERG